MKNDSADKATSLDPVTTHQRPILITLLVIISFIGGALSIPLVNSAYAQQVGVWYPYFLATSVFFGFVFQIGLWKMKRWSIYLFFVTTLIVQFVLLITNIWRPETLIEPAIVTVIILSYLSRME